MRLPDEPTTIERRPRSPVAGGRAAGAGRDPRARQRAPAVHRVYERHDRPAEGRGACARWVPREDRRGGRVPGRPAPRRAVALGDGSRLDHGPLGDRRLARPRCHRGAHRGFPTPSHVVPPDGAGVATSHQDTRCVADPDPSLADDRGRSSRRPRSGVAAGARVDGRAVGSRLVPLVALRDRGERPSDRQSVRRHRGRRVLPLSAPRRADQGGVARRPGVGHGRRHRRRRWAARRARRRRRARLPAAVAVDDPRRVA